jgi:hypothetical protein
MFKNYKVLFLSLFFVLFAIMIASIIWVNGKVKDNRLNEASDNILTLFHHEIDIQKSNALFLSVSLSGDKALRESLLDEDEDKGYDILIHKLNTLKEYTFIKDVRTQLLTKDLYIFARSWDNTFAGMPLEGFREDLQRIKKIRKPKVSIDPGRLLTIKATTPFRAEDGEVIGYIEAIKTFNELTQILRKRDIELTVLMYDDYLSVATLMRENPSFGNFVVSNTNYNSTVFLDLQDIDSKIYERENFIKREKFVHILDVMRDSAGEKIGFYVLSVSKDTLSEYENMKENISFFLNISKNDLYNVVESGERKEGAYRSVYDRAFLDLLGDLSNEERDSFEEAAREILKNYTKAELIDVILDKKHSKKIEGKIR